MRKLGLAAVAALALSAGAAQATVLTFNGGANCVGPSSTLVACASGAEISDTYGDVPGVLDVRYNDDDGSSLNTTLTYWADRYSDLTGVAYGARDDATGSPSIFLVPLNGNLVTLNGFDLGSYPSPNFHYTKVKIREIGGGLLYSNDNFYVDGTHAAHLTFNLTSSSGLEINWGPPGYDVGIDNIDFRVGLPVASAPEPSSWALMIGGFGLVGGVVRRKRFA